MNGHYILDAANRFIKAVVGYGSPVSTIEGMPLGLTKAGEVGLKIIPLSPPEGDALGIEQTPGLAIVTQTGTVAAGYNSVSMTTSNDFVGTILGVVVPDSMTVNWSTDDTNHLSAIPYTVTAGSIVIVTQRVAA
jgi:antitoxin (DNA-binding transcriptional repressor) of toxin-antitoxin stability system